MKYPLDEDFLNEMQELLKEDFGKYLNSFDEHSFNGLRVNTSKISVDEFLNIFPFDLKPIPWTKDGFYYNENNPVSKHPYYYAGLYYLQEPSAMLPACALKVNKGDTVLDVCAAPGGKSTKIASDLNDSGILIANDISPSRANALLKNIERFGIKNAYVTALDINNLINNYQCFFDKIIIDAPCSGEGMFRKDPAMIKNYKKKSKEEYTNIQKNIVDSAIKLLKPSGEMLYSTCTFDIKENEAIIDYLLSNNDNLEILPIDKIDGFSSGIAYNGNDELKKAVRLYPHRINGEGHFACKIRKLGTDNKIFNYHLKSDIIKNDGFNDFLSLINWNLNGRIFKQINDDIYLLPNISFDTSHIRVLRSGLHLGSIKGKNFAPSQALALALKKDEFRNIINLNIDDERVIKYLKGETIDISDHNYDEGYNLVCVNNYSLGFSKITNGIFKNKIAKGWIFE